MRSMRFLCLICALGAGAVTQASDRSLTCDRADAAFAPAPVSVPLPAREATAPYSEAERACWLDWPQAQALATQKGGQWVDVRDAGARHQSSLPGVIAVELTDVPNRAFLKGLPLLLIGTGVDLKALSSQCVALRESGLFPSVHLLLHGVRAWRDAGQAVQTSGVLLQPDEADAQELWLGAAAGLWRIAALGLEPDQLEQLPSPVAFSAAATTAADMPQALAQLHAHMRQSSSGEPQQRWLVVAATVAQAQQAQALWPAMNAQPAISSPVWLTGAWPAYAGYLTQQQSLAANAGHALPRLCGL